jgi:phosphatidylinositol alpha-1,6-mannosyltransferase
MSLVFLGADFPPSRGGIQTVAFELPLALSQAGVEVAVVTVDREGAEAFDARCPYPVVRVPACSKLQMAANLAAGAAQAVAQLHSPPRAVVATKWFPEGLAARKVRASARVPIALIAHGREFRLHGGNPGKWLLQRYILAGVRAGFAVSQWTAGQLIAAGLPAERVSVVHNGIRPEVYAAPKAVEELRTGLGLDDAPVLLTVGRLVERKGHAAVIRALPQVMAQLGPVSYVIAGSGPEESRLRAEVERLHLQEQVHFAGAVADDQLPGFYHLCDLFVMPTRELRGDPVEGFGIVYLEANAAGKPVLATRCGGVADAVEDQVSGVLLEPGDEDALVEAIVSLLGDRARLQEMGQAGLRRVRGRFTWDRIAQEFLEGLDRVGL